jgi:hypothetical protein
VHVHRPADPTDRPAADHEDHAGGTGTFPFNVTTEGGDRVRAIGTLTIDNLAVAGTASNEDRLVNNGDRARVRVRSVGGVLGGSCVRPASALARIAC